MAPKDIAAKCVERFRADFFSFQQFHISVVGFFSMHPELTREPLPLLHSLKSRLKDPDHLSDKVERKIIEGKDINAENFFSTITDLIGVRILHLYPSQFIEIHKAIKEKLDSGDWFLHEPPVAYSWDPESRAIFNELGIRTEIKDSFYTSIHYVVKPKADSNVCCEIQVRTLFEEIWGEIDHTINYPRRTEFLASKEQLRVLAKLISTGTRLADSIFRVEQEHRNRR